MYPRVGASRLLTDPSAEGASTCEGGAKKEIGCTQGLVQVQR